VEVLFDVSRLIISGFNCLTIGKRHGSDVILLPAAGLETGIFLATLPCVCVLFAGWPLLDHFERLCYYLQKAILKYYN
jgi:hypothetical protein